MTHEEAYQRMMETHAETGKWIDPVSEKEFPQGQALCRFPNREQRRRLELWRKTGKVLEGAHARMVPTKVDKVDGRGFRRNR